MKARSIARELALLGVSQLSDNTTTNAASRRTTGSRLGGRDTLTQTITAKPSTEALNALLKKALTTLGAEAQETIETAEGEMKRSNRLILESETRTIESKEVRSRILPAIPLVEAAINRVGNTLEMLMFVQQSDRKGMVTAKQALKDAAGSVEVADRLMHENEQKVMDIETVRKQIVDAIATVQQSLIGVKKALIPEHLSNLISHEDIRDYACSLLYNWIQHWQDIDSQLNEAMEKWTIRRLARVDRDILRLAMIDIVYLNVPKKVAIDEAVEMAKRYSDEDGYRFINGVLRRATDKLEEAK
ncbi:MAG: transcription antitermination factor NusB [Cyanobacteria bacterium J06621_11]